jgi:hypothetical protein
MSVENRVYYYLSRFEIAGAKRISERLFGLEHLDNSNNQSGCRILRQEIGEGG